MQNNQEISISKKVKRVGLQRYLCSKAAYEVEKVVLTDLIALFQNHLWLQSKAEVDIEFKQKFGSTLEVLTRLLKELNLASGLTERALRQFGSRLKQDLGSFLFPSRNYAQMKSKFSGTYTPIYHRPLGTPNKLIPPKKFIGKGYGDKGTAKKPELDASPSWQDVASVVSNKERIVMEKIHEEIHAATDFGELIEVFDKYTKTKKE